MGALCGACGDDQFDMVAFVAAGGTVYLLADPSRIERARSLLSLVAAEMFLAAETAAVRTRRTRLPQPYIAVLDELRYGITVPNLPYVASAQRKFGIGYVYAVQSAT
jgi:type IV secretory pathway TraG/TraD family ATPase VirD4